MTRPVARTPRRRGRDQRGRAGGPGQEQERVLQLEPRAGFVLEHRLQLEDLLVEGLRAVQVLDEQRDGTDLLPPAAHTAFPLPSHHRAVLSSRRRTRVPTLDIPAASRAGCASVALAPAEP